MDFSAPTQYDDPSYWPVYDPTAVAECSRLELARMQALPRREQHALRKKWRMGLAGIAIALALGGGVVASNPVRADSIIVDNLGNCTLAEAIDQANDINTGNLGNGCAVANSSGADSITLDVDVLLTEALPDITSEITIQGGGHTIARSAATSGFSVLTVGSGGMLTLNQVTISGGQADWGGGINNSGTLIVTNGIISGNTAGDYFGGGIYNSGTLTLTNSTVSGNTAGYGGGIYNGGGTATVSYSTIRDNYSSSNGGGVYNAGIANVENSTISGNLAHAGGGGIFNASSSTATVANSTISGDGAEGGGGICNNQGTVAVTNSTVTDNGAGSKPGGGGILNIQGTVTVKNTIIANQAMGDDCLYFLYAIDSLGYNIDSDSTCVLTGTGDHTYATGLSLDPTLANNGGPTLTHALLSGSPAIDAIPDEKNGCAAGSSLDQRGRTRDAVTGEGSYTCDIGAYEYQGGTTVIKTAQVRAGSAQRGIPTAGGLVAAIIGLWAMVVGRKKPQET